MKLNDLRQSRTIFQFQNKEMKSEKGEDDDIKNSKLNALNNIMAFLITIIFYTVIHWYGKQFSMLNEYYLCAR